VNAVELPAASRQTRKMICSKNPAFDGGLPRLRSSPEEILLS
jgi:hypothetical protein